MSEATASVWQFYVKTPDYGICCICQTSLSRKGGSTGAMHKHLKKHQDNEKVAEFLASKRKRERSNEPETNEDQPTFVDLNKTNIWKFFLQSSDKTLANCIFCYTNLQIGQGSTGSLHKHLKTHLDKEEVVQFIASKPQKSARTSSPAIKKEKNDDEAEDGSETMDPIDPMELAEVNPIQIEGCEESSSGKVRRNGSDVWNFFVKSEDKSLANCNICYTNLKISNGSTGCLHKHLRKHRDDQDVVEFLELKRIRTEMGSFKGEIFCETVLEAAGDEDQDGDDDGEEVAVDKTTQKTIVKALERIEGTLAVHTELLGELLQRRSSSETDSMWKKRRRSF